MVGSDNLISDVRIFLYKIYIVKKLRPTID